MTHLEDGVLHPNRSGPVMTGPYILGNIWSFNRTGHGMGRARSGPQTIFFKITPRVITFHGINNIILPED